MATITTEERIADLEHALALATACKRRCESRFVDFQKLVAAYIWQVGGVIEIHSQSAATVPPNAVIVTSNAGDAVVMKIYPERE